MATSMRASFTSTGSRDICRPTSVRRRSAAASTEGIHSPAGSSAVRSDTRICLQNGYHRTYALRCAGLKYAYCVVEDVTRFRTATPPPAR